jgi:hypothetical protein
MAEKEGEAALAGGWLLIRQHAGALAGSKMRVQLAQSGRSRRNQVGAAALALGQQRPLQAGVRGRLVQDGDVRNALQVHPQVLPGAKVRRQDYHAAAAGERLFNQRPADELVAQRLQPAQRPIPIVPGLEHRAEVMAETLARQPRSLRRGHPRVAALQVALRRVPLDRGQAHPQSGTFPGQPERHACRHQAEQPQERLDGVNHRRAPAARRARAGPRPPRGP